MEQAVRKEAETRLRRVIGQVGGIQRMLDEDRYCVDVLLQIASAQAALNQVNKLVLRSHVETCVAEAMSSEKAADRRRKIDELTEVFARYGWAGRGSG